jgi:BirA family biotin operon repressor/biotin-[acetyl-CoA-carboxylase] ligase
MSTRSQLLAYLKGAKENWISGESLSRKIGVSRAAIWKHIRRLKNDGYRIASSTKKGYLLYESSDLLVKEEIQDGLKTVLFGRQDIYHFTVADSTNLRARALAEKGAPEGTVVVAESQTEGRGRRGRIWFSPPREGLYISLILRPAMPPQDAPKLTLMTAVAVAELLPDLISVPIQIKWPNDIMVRGKKLAGILTQVSADMDIMDYAIIGFGINIGNDRNGFPEPLKDSATSIFLESGVVIRRVCLLRSYLVSFEKWYTVFRTSGFEPIIKRWQELSGIIGSHVTVSLPDRQKNGEVVGLDLDGSLLLRDQEGAIQKISSGEIRPDS